MHHGTCMTHDENSHRLREPMMQWSTRQSQNIFVYQYISIISVKWCQRRIGIGISHSVLARVRYHRNYPLLLIIKQIINKQIINNIHTPTDTRLFIFRYWILYRNPIRLLVNDAVVYHEPAKYTHKRIQQRILAYMCKIQLDLVTLYKTHLSCIMRNHLRWSVYVLRSTIFSHYMSGERTRVLSFRSHSVLYDNLQLGT